MKHNSKDYFNNNISFIDMLFNIIIVFVLLFFCAILLMNPSENKKNELEAKADIIITMSWPDMSPHDIDLWLKPPEGHFIGYPSKENSYIFLDRDDLGISNNYVIQDNNKVVVPTRREVISIRGKKNGRYVVNVQFYMAKDNNGTSLPEYNGEPVPVTVELVQINPQYKILTTKVIQLSQVKEEKTAFSFIIEDDNITNIESDIEEPFIQTAMDRGFRE